jgi:hypothetical protein
VWPDGSRAAAVPPIQIRLALGAEFDPFPNMRSDPPVFQSGTLAIIKSDLSDVFQGAAGCIENRPTCAALPPLVFSRRAMSIIDFADGRGREGAFGMLLSSPARHPGFHVVPEATLFGISDVGMQIAPEH